jgi:hypothetical protein
MKERPILFSAPMVRAILEGRKTQTRRLVKESVVTGAIIHGLMSVRPGFDLAKCPYGQPGDQLWVKEAIKCVDGGSDYAHVVFSADEGTTKADVWPWKRTTLPGMFMPRGLSRITLEVVSVRVERLNEISPYDACCEGLAPNEGDPLDPVGDFSKLWDSINAKRAPWASNPWVWRVEFKRC